MATALVIGGSGQIGRAVVPALLEDGWDVRVLARHPADVGDVVMGCAVLPCILTFSRTRPGSSA